MNAHGGVVVGSVRHEWDEQTFLRQARKNRIAQMSCDLVESQPSRLTLRVTTLRTERVQIVVPVADRHIMQGGGAGRVGCAEYGVKRKRIHSFRMRRSFHKGADTCRERSHLTADPDG